MVANEATVWNGVKIVSIFLPWPQYSGDVMIPYTPKVSLYRSRSIFFPSLGRLVVTSYPNPYLTDLQKHFEDIQSFLPVEWENSDVKYIPGATIYLPPYQLPRK